MLKQIRSLSTDCLSGSGQKAWAKGSAYCATKAGLDHFARCLALEEAASGIRVNTISPGLIMNHIHVKNVGMDPEKEERYIYIYITP